MGYYEERQQQERATIRRMVKPEVYNDRIILCGQTIKRPPGVAPSQWFDVWESFAA
jgi:hypothetical protein